MQRLSQIIQGDKALWGLVILLLVFSFMPVYSASSNLAFLYDGGNTGKYLAKHFFHVTTGIIILYLTHQINPKYFRNLSLVLVPISAVLLLVVLLKGQTIGDANASRWLRLPFIQVTFQPSEVAKLSIIMYVARFMTRNPDKIKSFKESFWPLFVPVAGICLLILPANFSTAALVFFLCLVVMVLGGMAWKNIFTLIGIGLAGLALFIVFVMAFPNVSNRVDTWKSRIETYWDGGDSDTGYQVEKSKIAIASGGLTGEGPGKSVQKNFLPQSNSDFIFSVIVEEYGLVMGLILLFMFGIFFMRALSLLAKIDDPYSALLAFGCGFSICFQAFANMAVAVNLFPVTGQPLPFLSSGGTSLWLTCFMVGIILSMSRLVKNKELGDEVE